MFCSIVLIDVVARRVYAHIGALAATGNALTLEKALRQRMWPGSREECRQLPNIGKLLGSRLAANGMGSLLALKDTDPRKIEAVTQRNYPFGGWPYLQSLCIFTVYILTCLGSLLEASYGQNWCLQATKC